MNRIMSNLVRLSFGFLLCTLGSCAADEGVAGDVCETAERVCADAQANIDASDAAMTLPDGGELNADVGLPDDASLNRDMVAAPDPVTVPSEDEVVFVTRLGEFIIKVNFERAPVSSRNFMQYVDDGFYDGADGAGQTSFHRVMSGFMIQGGGLIANGVRKQTRSPIINESMNGLDNLRGSVAMARTSEPNSATSQFFINHIDNVFLDYTADNVGYAVFGEVVSGMDVVDLIAAEMTNPNDEPITPIFIEQSSRRIE
jgi:peptidyl-prolyl cis-trans isomerase A (cyclophilin A)